MRVRWTRPALNDLEGIGDYVAKGNPVAAARLVARIFDHVDALSEHPKMGRIGRVSGTREFVVSDTPFVVPYRIRGDEVEVLAVFHAARRWPKTFD
jgi:addiction module RelE/StbE family toxin